MEFQVDTLGPCRKKVVVKVPPERIREEYDRQYDEINKSLVLPGFRKGHAPRRLLEKRFSSHLGAEVKEKILKAALERLAEEKKVEPLAPPTVDLSALTVDPAKALEISFELVTKPEFETPKYKGLEAKVPAPTAPEEEVQRAVDVLRRRRAKLEPAGDVEIAAGDVAVVDWTASLGESVVARDDGVFHPLGRGVLGGFAAFEIDTALLGRKPGAIATARVTAAPDDPREEIRGKELELVATLREVRRYVLPPVDAELLKAHDYEGEEEMREDLRKRILRAKRREAERAAEESLVEMLLGSVEISLPPDFVEREMEGWAQRRRLGAQMEGRAEDEVTQEIAAASADARSHIEHDMRRFFLLERIAKAEGVEVTQEEMSGAIDDIAQAYGRPVEEVLGSFRDPGRLSELASQIRHRKVREILRRSATLVETAATSVSRTLPTPPASGATSAKGATAPKATQDAPPPKKGRKSK